VVILSTIGVCCGLLLVSLAVYLLAGNHEPDKPPRRQSDILTAKKPPAPPTPRETKTAGPAEREQEQLATLFSEPIELLTSAWRRARHL
jgi:hypothetical protein